MKELSEKELKKKCKTCKNKETDLCYITQDTEGKLKCVNYEVAQNTTFKLSEKGYGQGFYEGQMLERKYWEYKIKAKIQELEAMSISQEIYYEDILKILQSLLGKE